MSSLLRLMCLFCGCCGIFTTSQLILLIVFACKSVVITNDNNTRHSVRVTLNMRSYKYSGGVFITNGSFYIKNSVVQFRS